MPERPLELGGGCYTAGVDRASALGLKIVRERGKIGGTLFASTVLGLSWFVAGPARPDAFALPLVIVLVAVARWHGKNRQRLRKLADTPGAPDV